MIIQLSSGTTFKHLYHKIRHLLKRALCLSALLILPSSAVMALDADISVGIKSIRFSASSPDVRIMQVRIVGPNGAVVYEDSSNGSALNWSLPISSGDGLYTYDVTLSTAQPRERERTQTENQFSAGASTQATHQIETLNGAVRAIAGNLINPDQQESSTQSVPAQNVSSLLTLLLDFLIPDAYAQIVHSGSVTIDGSLCTGFDCATTESYGFDTVRLKENNLRMHFDDTSNTASFPKNDWRITINDSSNGGSEYFAIDDATSGRHVFKVSAGAPVNALTVDSAGDVGIGVDNAVVDLHIRSGNTPTTRLEQDGSSGFTPQTWDMAGNETNFFIRDATNGSSLPFRIIPGAATDSLYIDAHGNVGIGLNPDDSKKLEVKGDTRIHGNLEIVELAVSSSRTQKNQIQALSAQQALTTLLELEPVSFAYKRSPEEQTIGFIAEDVPELVATSGRKTINPMDIVAVLTKVVQEQQRTIDQLSVQIQNLSAHDSKVE